MGTEVLLSRDSLRPRFAQDADTFLFSRSRPKPSRISKSLPHTTRNSRNKRRCKDATAGQMVVKIPRADLVMEKVKILKRGEEFKPSSPPKDLRSDGGCDFAAAKDSRSNGRSSVPKVENDDSILCSTDRLGPDPDLVPKQIRLRNPKSDGAVYAGSGFSFSPSPTSLPIPNFSLKKSSLSSNSVNDLATKDLRRLLRLDLLS